MEIKTAGEFVRGIEAYYAKQYTELDRKVLSPWLRDYAQLGGDFGKLFDQVTLDVSRNFGKLPDKALLDDAARKVHLEEPLKPTVREFPEPPTDEERYEVQLQLRALAARYPAPKGVST